MFDPVNPPRGKPMILRVLAGLYALFMFALALVLLAAAVAFFAARAIPPEQWRKWL